MFLTIFSPKTLLKYLLGSWLSGNKYLPYLPPIGYCLSFNNDSFDKCNTEIESYCLLEVEIHPSKTFWLLNFFTEIFIAILMGLLFY